MFSFPRIKFADTNTADEQVQHIYSEMVEFMKEHNRDKRGLRDEELMDCWHSIETYFRIRQAQGIDVHAIHTQTIKKNRVRGYYDGESRG